MKQSLINSDSLTRDNDMKRASLFAKDHVFSQIYQMISFHLNKK